MTVKLTVEHGGQDYAGEVMVIKSTRLGWEDHGILTAYLHCESTSGGVGVGGYCLDVPPAERGKSRLGTAYGLDHVMALMRTVGVDKWEDLPGRRVIVLSAGAGGWGARSIGIANIDTGKALLLDEHADQWKLADGIVR